MIRKARTEDLNEIVLSTELIVKEMNNLGNFQWDSSYPKKEDFELDIQNGSLYVKELENNIIGFVCIDTNEPVEYKNIEWSKDETSTIIHRLGVLPNMRKKGIATELLFFAEKLSLDKQIYSIKTDTNILNTNMLALFKKQDYKKIGSVSFQGVKEEFLCFEKLLPHIHFEDLYKVGVNFDIFIGSGFRSERERITILYQKISFEPEIIEKIKSCTQKIFFLVTAESWCPDVQINIAVLRKICEINRNFDISIITKGRGEKFLKPLLGTNIIKIPTILTLDNNYSLINTFIERPLTIKEHPSFETIKIDYFKGKYALDTATEILSFLDKM